MFSEGVKVQKVKMHQNVCVFILKCTIVHGPEPDKINEEVQIK